MHSSRRCIAEPFVVITAIRPLPLFSLSVSLLFACEWLSLAFNLLAGLWLTHNLLANSLPSSSSVFQWAHLLFPLSRSTSPNAGVIFPSLETKWTRTRGPRRVKSFALLNLLNQQLSVRYCYPFSCTLLHLGCSSCGRFVNRTKIYFISSLPLPCSLRCNSVSRARECWFTQLLMFASFTRDCDIKVDTKLLNWLQEEEWKSTNLKRKRRWATKGCFSWSSKLKSFHLHYGSSCCVCLLGACFIFMCISVQLTLCVGMQLSTGRQ